MENPCPAPRGLSWHSEQSFQSSIIISRFFSLADSYPLFLVWSSIRCLPSGQRYRCQVLVKDDSAGHGFVTLSCLLCEDHTSLEIQIARLILGVANWYTPKRLYAACGRFPSKWSKRSMSRADSHPYISYTSLLSLSIPRISSFLFPP